MNIKRLLVASTLCAASISASAIPLSGGVSFSADGDAFTFDTVANTVDFADGGTNAEVNAVSGDFVDYFAIADEATFSDFSYDPFGGPTTIWSAIATQGANLGTVVDFTLIDISNVLEVGNSVLIDGTGMLSDGIDSAAANWNITMNQAGGTFSWSSSTSTPVPEPGTMLLFGLGLAGLAASGRRKV
ncbi:MAG: PEP-CTERM sorting domain-containing protein [Exilibacterium sp.]